MILARLKCKTKPNKFLKKKFCFSTSHMLPPEKVKNTKENDLNISNYHKNLYHSLNQMNNPLIISKDMETTEL